eukprot:TRINITY_DN185_c0_g1_i1.p1 TRINITY_DN185_c0_g1~~TRINITY_DN185_c0_g1_i1.p1  ORF type:complete len:937 (-),score=170.81 TRINITY_DN185_c0_g1_i1:23-2833(-)
MGNVAITSENLEKYANPLINLKQLQKLAKQVYEEYPFLDQIFESLIITDNDKDNIIVYANSSFERVSGYAKQEIIGKNCRFLQGVHTDQKTVDKLRYSIKEGVPVDVELLNYRKDGLPFWNNLLMLPVHKHGRSGKTTYFIGIQKDITSLKYDTDPRKWSPPEVAAWLTKVSCGDYSKSFITNSVTGDKLFKMEFSFIEDPAEYSKISKLVEKLRENPIDFFDEEKKQLAAIDMKWRKNGEFPTAEQIQMSQIWRKRVRLALPPALKAAQKTDFPNLHHLMLTSRLPGKYGEVENVRFVGSNYTAVTFKTSNIYGIYDYSTNSWRDIVMSKDKRTSNSTYFPYFVSLHNDDENDLGELVVFNVLTSVQTKYTLWTEGERRPVSGIFAGEQYIYIVTTDKLYRRKYFDTVNEEVPLKSDVKFPEKCGALSSLSGALLFVVSANKKILQLWNVDNGVCVASITESDPIAQSSCNESTLVATTKSHLLVWREPKFERISFPHPFITSVFVVDNDHVVVGDINYALSLYDLNTKSVKKLNLTKEREGDVFTKMNEGVYSISNYDNGFIVCGTDKSIEIWNLSLVDQQYPVAKMKTEGPVIQIAQDMNEHNSYKFLLRGDIYQIISWTPQTQAMDYDDETVELSLSGFTEEGNVSLSGGGVESSSPKSPQKRSKSKKKTDDFIVGEKHKKMKERQGSRTQSSVSTDSEGEGKKGKKSSKNSASSSEETKIKKKGSGSQDELSGSGNSSPETSKKHKHHHHHHHHHEIHVKVTKKNENDNLSESDKVKRKNENLTQSDKVKRKNFKHDEKHDKKHDEKHDQKHDEKHDKKQEKPDEKHDKHDQKQEKHDEKHDEKHETKPDKHDTKHDKHDPKHDKHDQKQEKHDEKHDEKHETKPDKHDTKHDKHDPKHDKHDQKQEKHDEKHDKHETKPEKQEKPDKHHT